MRQFLVLSTVLLGAGVARAAPGPAAPAGGPPSDAARTFALQLVGVVDQVADQYVRPVAHEDLLRAALAGLYEAARQPVPPRIRALAPVGPDSAQRPDPLGFPPAPPPPAERLLRLAAAAFDDVSRAELLRGRSPLLICCQALARSLDPYCAVVTAEEQQRTLGLDAECDGVGLEVKVSAGGAVVEGVQLGGPAQKGGMRPGDTITHLNGTATSCAPPALLLALRNRRPPVTLAPLFPVEEAPAPEEAPGPVRVTFRRPGEAEARTVVLSPERFRPETVLGVVRRVDNSWDYLIDRKRRIAHVRLAALGRGTAEELHAVLAGLKEGGLNGLVLDLRWCPGGYLNEALEVAELFLGEGTVATVKSRSAPPAVYRSTDHGKYRSFPLVVLVNGETSGGAELIAAALQDHKRALVVGQRTLGKASVQVPFALGQPGVALKLTTGTFVRPSGKNLHRFPASKPEDDWGVRPDEGGELRLSADLGRQLRRWWLEQSLRPGPSRQRLTLDDPSADPQRQAALAMLLRRAG
jgi:carboxyl-terminal processing protease